MADTGDINVGTIIRFNNELCLITEYQHRTPGNLRAFYQAKMKNLKSNKSVEYRFRSGESVDIARVEHKMMEYLYDAGDELCVMDKETFEQVNIAKDMLGNQLKFVKEGMDIKVSFEGDLPILAETPTFVNLAITYAEPAVKGNTSNGALKKCNVETGAEIMVPLFYNEGDILRIDTRTGDYVERVTKG
ncbi:MAG: elongation factor P [Bacteroidia bacterium]|nr:elongation factor P [Bacteroidia bacterium]